MKWYYSGVLFLSILCRMFGHVKSIELQSEMILFQFLNEVKFLFLLKCGEGQCMKEWGWMGS